MLVDPLFLIVPLSLSEMSLFGGLNDVAEIALDISFHIKLLPLKVAGNTINTHKQICLKVTEGYPGSPGVEGPRFHGEDKCAEVITSST